MKDPVAPALTDADAPLHCSPRTANGTARDLRQAGPAALVPSFEPRPGSFFSPPSCHGGRLGRKFEQRRSLPIESNDIATAAAWLSDQKKGLDIRVLDVREHIKVADYFVIVTGTSRPHIRAIQQEIHVRLKAAGVTHGREEGGDLGWWVLMDYGDVIVHVMQPEAREYYDLDGLYQDAAEVAWRESALPELPQTKQRAVGG